MGETVQRKIRKQEVTGGDPSACAGKRSLVMDTGFAQNRHHSFACTLCFVRVKFKGYYAPKQ